MLVKLDPATGDTYLVSTDDSQMTTSGEQNVASCAEGSQAHPPLPAVPNDVTKNSLVVEFSGEAKHCSVDISADESDDLHIDEEASGDTDVGGFLCPVCSKTFQWKSHLSDHMMVHSSLKEVFVCEVCNKCYSRKDDLRRHMLGCRRVKDMQDGETAIQPTSWKQDQATTVIEAVSSVWKPPRARRKSSGHSPGGFLCLQCDKSFTSRYNLMRHEAAIHCDFRPYKCDQCEKKFSCDYDLSKHQRSHSNDRPYVCPVCLRGFKWDSHMRQHASRHVKS